MKFLAPLFARRYLFSRKSRSVINLIAGVSCFALAMPAAAMVILLSVFNGFDGLIRSMASTFDADLTLSLRQGTSFNVTELDTEAMKRIEGVRSLSPVFERKVMMGFESGRIAATLRGVDDGYDRTVPLGEALYAGHFEVTRGDVDCAILGRSLAYELGFRYYGDDPPIEIYALGRGSFSSLLPMDAFNRRKAQVSALFMLDAQTEGQYVITSLRLARDLFDAQDLATAIMVRLDDGADEKRVREELLRIAGEDFRARNRYEMNPMLYRMITAEKRGIFLITLLVLIVASFSAVGALVMLIIDKRDDVETLRALGAPTPFIRRIFICEGLLIGAVGGGAGLLLGLLLSLGQQHFGWIAMPADNFVISSYPVIFRWTDFIAAAAALVAVVSVVSVATTRRMISNPTRRP